MSPRRRHPSRARRGPVPVRVEVDPATGMNRTEARYAAHLDALVLLGEILRWRFEAVTFTLAPRCRYTPDFEIVLPDGQLCYHEVKGFWREDARVKVRAAARLFDDRTFVAATERKRKDGGGWQLERFQAHGDTVIE